MKQREHDMDNDQEEEPQLDATPDDVSEEEIAEEDVTPESAEDAQESGEIPSGEPDDTEATEADDDQEVSDDPADDSDSQEPETDETSDEVMMLAEEDGAEPGEVDEEPDQAIEDEPMVDEPAQEDSAGSDDEEATSGEAGQLDEGVPELVLELEFVTPAKSKADEDEISAPKLTSVHEARSVLEAFLFASNEPLSVNRLSKLMNNLHPRTVQGLLLELQMEYDGRNGGLQIVEVAGGFQMATRPHLAEWMFRLHKHRRRSALSQATLETLAIIAYKQPITKAEVEVIRGVESSGTMRTLQDLSLVGVTGRKEVVGRPQLYGTTDQFLKVFGLRSLADLPSIQELRHLFADQQKLTRAMARPHAKQEEMDLPSEPEEKAQTTETAENPLDENAPVQLEGGSDEGEEIEAEYIEESDASEASEADETEASDETEGSEEAAEETAEAEVVEAPDEDQ